MGRTLVPAPRLSAALLVLRHLLPDGTDPAGLRPLRYLFLVHGRRQCGSRVRGHTRHLDWLRRSCLRDCFRDTWLLRCDAGLSREAHRMPADPNVAWTRSSGDFQPGGSWSLFAGYQRPWAGYGLGFLSLA